MEKILVMDEHNYDDNLGEILRIAIRGIIFVGGKLLMIEDSSGEVKLPGGGMEPGEDDHQALIREVKEKTTAHKVVDLPSIVWNKPTCTDQVTR